MLRFNLDDPASQNIRIQSLFGRLELFDRVVTEQEDFAQIQMNYDPIQAELSRFRAESLEYLKKSLTEEEAR